MRPIQLCSVDVRALVSTVVLWLIAAAPPATAQTEPRQDAEALMRIDAMFEQLGGRETWAGARSLFLHYRQWPTGENARLQEEHGWRDFREPNERLEWNWTDAEGVSVTRARGFADGELWRRGPDGVETLMGAERDDYLSFWEFDIYTMFSRLSLGDGALSIHFIEPNRIEIFDEDDTSLGWWEIDVRGNLLRWGATFNEEEELSYLYGPYKDYGDIAFPAWGSSTDGRFRFEYVDVRVSAAPLPADVLNVIDARPSDELLAAPLE